jgi:threonine dehydratase
MTYWVEFFESFARGEAPDVVFVPLGLGSGFSAAAAARAHTGVKTRLVGVVSAHATMYQQSFRARRAIESPVTTVLADGMACRVPEPDALDMLLREADDVVAVSDDEVAEAMRVLFADTHNVAEGAGAPPPWPLRCNKGDLLQGDRWWAPRCAAATWTVPCLRACCPAPDTTGPATSRA